MWHRALLATTLPSLYYYAYSSNRVVVDAPPIQSDVPLVFVHGLKGCNLVEKETNELRYLTLHQSLGLSTPQLRLPCTWENGVQSSDSLTPLDALHSLSFAGVRVHSIYDVFLEWMNTHNLRNVRPCYSFTYDWRRDLTENLEKLVEFVERVYLEHGSRVQVVGHSMGALLTFSAINSRPELFHSALLAGCPFGPGYGYLKDLHIGSPTGYNLGMFTPAVLWTFASSWWTFPLTKKDAKAFDTGVHRVKLRDTEERPKLLSHGTSHGKSKRKKKKIRSTAPVDVVYSSDAEERRASGIRSRMGENQAKSSALRSFTHVASEAPVSSEEASLMDVLAEEIAAHSSADTPPRHEQGLSKTLLTEIEMVKRKEAAPPLSKRFVQDDDLLERVDASPWEALWWTANNIGVFRSYETLREASKPLHVVEAEARARQLAAEEEVERKGRQGNEHLPKPSTRSSETTRTKERQAPPTDEEIEWQAELIGHLQQSLNRGRMFKLENVRFRPDVVYPHLAVLSGVGHATLAHVVKDGPAAIDGWDFETGRALDGDGRIPYICSKPPNGTPYESFVTTLDHQSLLNDLQHVRQILLQLLAQHR